MAPSEGKKITKRFEFGGNRNSFHRWTICFKDVREKIYTNDFFFLKILALKDDELGMPEM